MAGSEEANETGYNLFSDQFDNYFEGSKKDREKRGGRFKDVMTFFHAGGKWERDGLIRFYDWEALSDGGLVVELGGSTGDMCIDLARRYHKIRYLPRPS